jgi:hypothetical protein
MPTRKRKASERVKPGDRKAYPAPFPMNEMVKYNGRPLWGEKIRYGSVGKVVAVQSGWESPMEVHDGYCIIEFPDGRAAVDLSSAKRVFQSLGQAISRKEEDGEI